MKARTSMCLLLAGCRFFQQNMRNTLANVVVQMGVTPTEKGALLSKIALGYLLTQVPGGALADWMGTKNVITCTMLLSALCCLILPTAFDSSGIIILIKKSKIRANTTTTYLTIGLIWDIILCRDGNDS